MSIFPKTRFLKEKGVGLRLYIYYVISKTGCNWFCCALTGFALKMELFWKSDKERRTLCFSMILL